MVPKRMWYVATYRPAALFSLKDSQATNMAARTLIAPSPYAIKMAMLDKIITFYSLEMARESFGRLKEMQVRYNLCPSLVINNCFVKILKEPKEKKEGKAFQQSVCFREYAYFGGDMQIAVELKDNDEKQWLDSVMCRIGYFGKRGCFFQYLSSEIRQELESGYSCCFDAGVQTAGILVPMDDFGPQSTFDKVSNFSNDKTDRKKRIYLFPFVQRRSTKAFSLLEKIHG